MVHPLGTLHSPIPIKFISVIISIFDFYSFQNRQNVLNALVITRSRGKTNTNEAVELALDQVFVTNEGDRSDAEDVMIIVTNSRTTQPKGRLKFRF